MKKNLFSTAALAFIFLAALPGCKKDGSINPQHLTKPQDVITNDTVVLVDHPSNNPTEFNLGYWDGADYSNPTSPEIPVTAWTIYGFPSEQRELLKFDLSSINTSATVTKALLFLYSDPKPQNGNLQTANFGCDGIFIQQVDSAWNPKTVNWFNQPPGSRMNEVGLPDTQFPFEDEQVDVTGIVQSMVQTGNNFGFRLLLQNYMIYSSRIFVSSYSPDTARHPRLVVTYVNSQLSGVVKRAKAGSK